MNEICQLYVEDVRNHDDVPCISVTDENNIEDAKKRLKSSSASRLIPIHKKLLALGFLDFVEAVRSDGNIRLFPDLEADTRGYYSDAFQKWFSRFIKGLDAKTPKTTFHSFRHSFRDAMRNASISEDVARALGGWADQRTSEIYGSGFSVARLNDAIQRIEYSGLRLPPRMF